MKSDLTLPSLVLFACVFIFTACTPTETNWDVDPTRLSAEGKLGMQIFKQKKCSTCHTMGRVNKASLDHAGELIVPDLSNPLIANDSLFVKAHFTLSLIHI